MTDKEIKEAEKSFRVSIKFWKWVFIIYGNWKRRIIKLPGKPFFRILDFHPLNPKQYEEL